MPVFLCFTMSRSLLKLLSIELVIPSNHLILCLPLLLLPSHFPSIGPFPMSWKNNSDSLWVIPTSACEKPTWHIWVTLRTLLENVDREFPGGLVVRIPGFLCFGLLQSLVRELRFCKSHGTAEKKKNTYRQGRDLELEISWSLPPCLTGANSLKCIAHQDQSQMERC